MPDNITLAKAPRPQHNWFSSATPVPTPIVDALEALENGASNSASITHVAEQVMVQAEARSESAIYADVEEVTPADGQAEHETSQGSPVVEDLDFELVVGSLLDDISSVMDDVRENRMTLNEQLVDLIAKSFEDIARHIENVPQYLAIEVGELGAEICDVIEAHGASAQPIIAIFNS